MIFFFYLAYNIPLTGDDWTWGTERGLTRLKNYFDGYNGRYVSNVFEIILTRSDLLRYIVMAFFSMSLIYLIGELYDDREQLFYRSLAFVILLLMPVNMLAQTFAWTAGYVNYVISLVALLIYLVLTKNIFEDTEPVYSKSLWIFFIPLGITTQLLVEHISLFSMVIAFFVIIYVYIKFKKFYLEHIVYFVSLLVGSIIMFSNKTYINVLLGNDNYRSVKEDESEGLFSKFYDAYTGKMHEYLFFDSWTINVFIGIMLVVLLLNNAQKNAIKIIPKYVLALILTGSIFYLTVGKATLANDYLQDEANAFEALISLVFFITVLVTIILYIKNRDIKSKLILYYMGFVLLTLPFVFITPYGPRASLASYLFLVLIGIELYKYNKETFNWSGIVMKRTTLLLSAVLIIFYTTVFTQIGNTSRERLAYLQSEVEKGSDYIQLTSLPHSQFLWMSSPKREHFKKMFKKFYGVPKDTEIEFVPFDKDAKY